MDYALSINANGLVNNRLSIADICFVCEMCQLSRERAHIKILNQLDFNLIYNRKTLNKKYKQAMQHFDNLCNHSAFSPDIEPLMKKLSEIENTI